MDRFQIGYIIAAIIGYLLGSVLFAKVWSYAFKGRDVTKETKDGNPGTFNAFEKGGFWCGVLTLIGDLGKGFLPVFLCVNYIDAYDSNEWLMALVMIAPVVGHILPIFHKFNGGKGIATTFGSLLGFVPDLRPALVLAVVFVIFSVAIIIRPDFYKTMATYLIASVAVFFTGQRLAVVLAYIVISVFVVIRLVLSKEDREDFSVSLFKWTVMGKKEESREESRKEEVSK